jgi:signal transduction histidine kinase
MKESVIEENAKQKATLGTAEIVGEIKKTQIKMEERVLILASIAAEKYEKNQLLKDIIYDVLSATQEANIVSGGIWFEPYAINSKKENEIIFFNRNKTGKFYPVEDYMETNPNNYREMEFYSLTRYLKEGEIFWTKVYSDPVTRVRMITVVSPIYRDGKFIGAASIDIKVGYYDKKIKAFDNNYFMIIDRAGTFITKSLLVEKHMKKEDIYQVDDPKLSSMLKYIMKTLNQHEKKAQYNSNIANKLSESSLEIDLKDGKRIASIMGNREKSISENIESQIHFIKTDPLLGEKSVLALFHFSDTDWDLIVGISEEEVLAQTNQTYKIIIFITLITTLLATIIGYFLLKISFVRPVESVNQQLENSMQEDGNYKLLECDDKGEIGTLVNNLNTRATALESAQKREAEEIEKRIINEKLLVQQSKMAAMGEMMDAVAHQWKQPLNALSMYSEIIKSDFEDGSVDQKYVDQFKDDIQLQISHMVNTLDEFRTFFRPNKEEQDFQLQDVINSVLFLTKDEFLKNRIIVQVEREDFIQIHGSENEFKHLILNIINNAKDAFNDNNITEKRVIVMRLIDDDESKRVEIEDNAGGIPEHVIDDIFKANVTTKEEGKGTGIGLYMSMQIAQKHHATLSVKNQNDGACFTIAFEK